MILPNSNSIHTRDSAGIMSGYSSFRIDDQLKQNVIHNLRSINRYQTTMDHVQAINFDCRLLRKVKQDCLNELQDDLVQLSQEYMILISQLDIDMENHYNSLQNIKILDVDSERNSVMQHLMQCAIDENYEIHPKYRTLRLTEAELLVKYSIENIVQRASLEPTSTKFLDEKKSNVCTGLEPKKDN